MIEGVLVFLILLPFATALLGSVLGLLDRTDGPATLRRIAWRGLPFLAAGLLLGSGAALPASLAVVTALGLHVGVTAIIRLALRRGWLTASATPRWDDRIG